MIVARVNWLWLNHVSCREEGAESLEYVSRSSRFAAYNASIMTRFNVDPILQGTYSKAPLYTDSYIKSVS